MNRINHGMALVLAAALIGGCAGNGGARSYDEKFNSVLVSQDGTQLLLLGRQYHYIFAAPPDLLATLRKPQPQEVAAEFAEFEVADDNRVEAVYRLQAAPELDKKQRKALKKQMDGQLDHEFDLKGMRFDANGFTPPPQLVQLTEYAGTTIKLDKGANKTMPPNPTPLRAVGSAVVNAEKGVPLYTITSAPVARAAEPPATD